MLLSLHRIIPRKRFGPHIQAVLIISSLPVLFYRSMFFLPYFDVFWKIVITFAVKKQYKRHLTRRLFGVQVAGIVLLLLFLLYEFHHIEYLPISHFAFEFNYLSFIFHLINTEIEWVVSSLFNSSANGIRKPLLKFCCCF